MGAWREVDEAAGFVGSTDPNIVFCLDEVEHSEVTFDDIDITVEVSGDISDEQREALHEGVRRSPVWNLMRLPNDMGPSVEVAKTGIPPPTGTDCCTSVPERSGYSARSTGTQVQQSV